MKKVILMFLLLLFVLVGCGGETTGSNAKKTLVVGTTHASPPNAFVNEETNESDGVMIDIIKEVADRGGYELEFDPMTFNSLIPSLDSDRVDIIAAGMGITDERAKTVSFTDPVYGFQEALVVPAGNKNHVQSLKNLDNESVGVSAGTFYYDYLVDSDIPMNVKAYDTTSEMLLDLTNGRIQAAINDRPVVEYLNEHTDEYDVETVDEYDPNFLIEVGLIVNKNNDELLKELNEIIDEIKEDGTLEDIHKKWGTTWYDS